MYTYLVIGKTLQHVVYIANFANMYAVILLLCVVLYQIQCSDVCTGLQYMHTMLYQRTTDACWISHATLNYSRNVSDSRAVVPYAERPYITCSFQAMHVSTHKWLIRKTLHCIFGAITRQSYFTSSSNTENSHL